MFLGWGRRRCRTWLWLYLDKKISFSSESSLSSSRVLKDWGRYPYRMAFLMTDCSRILSSALRYPHQAGLAYRSCETRVACVTSQALRELKGLCFSSLISVLNAHYTFAYDRYTGSKLLPVSNTFMTVTWNFNAMRQKTLVSLAMWHWGTEARASSSFNKFSAYLGCLGSVQTL